MCSSGSEDDEDMEACLLICIGLFYNRNRTAKRKPVILRKRLCLEYQVQLLLEEGQKKEETVNERIKSRD